MSIPPTNEPKVCSIPIGGIGTGGFQMGADGRIVHVTMNNNRSEEIEIPAADGAFLAVRASIDGQVAARILQTASSVPFQEAGIKAPFVTQNQIGWSGLYPTSTYGLRDTELPLSVSWRVFSPVLPYDTEASTLPMAMFSVQVANKSEHDCDASVLLNWESLRGCSGKLKRKHRGDLNVIAMNEHEELMPLAPALAVRRRDPVLGAVFGLGERITRDADGDYTLIAAPRPEQVISFCGWRHESVSDIKTVWWSFVDEGLLPNNVTDEEPTTSAALCIAQNIPPGGKAQYSFMLTWICPQYTLDGANIGNGYLARYRDSIEIAGYGLRHHKYFLKAVDHWQQRFLSSSLPGWFSRALLNSAAALTAHTHITRDGTFILCDEVDNPSAQGLCDGIFSSLGTLLPYPMYAHAELGQYAGVLDTIEHPRLRESLVTQLGANDANSLELGVKLILAAARNFRMTGSVARLVEVMPRLQEIAKTVATYDRNGDGLPELSDGAPLDGYLAGLCVAAWAAIAFVAKHSKHDRESAQYTAMAQKASETFERNYWNNKEGLYTDSGGAKVLAGHWYRMFLRLNAPPIPRKRVLRATQTMAGHDSRHDEADTTTGRTDTACFASALIEFGEPDAGLEMIRNDLGDRYTSNPDGMAIWHAFYALEGFLLSLPDKSLYVAPNLPEGVDYLNAPIFTPVCMGWLTYQVDRGKGYRQNVRLAFDSPVEIKRFELRVPNEIAGVEVYFTSDGEVRKVVHQTANGDGETILSVELPRPTLIQESATLTVVELSAANPSGTPARP